MRLSTLVRLKYSSGLHISYQWGSLNTSNLYALDCWFCWMSGTTSASAGSMLVHAYTLMHSQWCQYLARKCLSVENLQIQLPLTPMEVTHIQSLFLLIPIPTYCVAGWKPELLGWHWTPATITLSMLPNSSGRLAPVIVTVVPPSTGPPVGVNCAKRRIHLYIIRISYFICASWQSDTIRQH